MFKYADSAVMYWLRVAQNAQAAGREATPLEIYRALELYYLNNGLYDVVAQLAQAGATWSEGMKPMRNPAHRVVEFYVSKLWPGALPDALPIVTDNKAIVDPIKQVWHWSNWGVKKQLAARWYSLFGDLIIKVPTHAGDDGQPDRVYFQLIKPELATDFDLDDRGFITYIRLDIPLTRRVGEKIESYYHTEVWNKTTGRFMVFEHTKTPQTEITRLGPPITNLFYPDEFGIDFVPFTHAKFQDIGEVRGVGSFVHALDKIDEANRQATRLAQMLFRYNRPFMGVTAGGLDPSGRPLPAPRIGGGNPGTSDSDEIIMGDDTLMRLPGNSQAFALVPNINYESALAVLNSHMLELEHDLPELAYYRLRDLGGDLSGRAVRLMLSDSVDKAKEARGNAEVALARANAMALTIGQNAGLFSNIGTYEAGDFDHTFQDRPIIPLSESEVAELIKSDVDTGIPMITALRRHGWSEDDLKQLAKDQKAEDKRKQQSFGQMVLSAQRDFDAGNQPGAQSNEDDDSED